MDKLDLTGIRKHLHAHPELSEEEFKTADYIKQTLKKIGVKHTQSVGETGVIAVFEGQELGDITLLRADTDALPIQEINEFEHKSTVDGVSHKCGHDGHTTIMLGVAEQLEKQAVKKGKVILLFQPAEENGRGAKSVLADPYFKDLKVDYVFALHNLPSFNTHEIVVKKDVFTANVVSMIIKLRGKTAHAAEPEKGDNPSMAMAEIAIEANNMVKNTPERDDFFLVTPVYSAMGELAYGISAGAGELHYTIRAWDTKLLKENCTSLEAFIKEGCNRHDLKYEISWLEEFDANINQENAVDYISSAAKNNGFKLNTIEHPFKWGEDFGLFTQKYKGAMFGIGAGSKMPALHNPDYDYPDEITETGISMFTELVKLIHE